MGSLGREQSFQGTESLGGRVVYLGLSGLAITASFIDKARQSLVDYVTQDDLCLPLQPSAQHGAYHYDCVATNSVEDRP